MAANLTVQKPQLSPVLRDDKPAQGTLASMLAQCFDGLKLYGKEPEQLENTVKLFRLALADFDIEKIQSAFVTHLQRSSEMPTPADIVNLIKRGNKPPFSQAMYIALAQKRERTQFKDGGGVHDCLTLEEGRYMREYEEFQING